MFTLMDNSSLDSLDKTLAFTKKIINTMRSAKVVRNSNVFIKVETEEDLLLSQVKLIEHFLRVKVHLVATKHVIEKSSIGVLVSTREDNILPTSVSYLLSIKKEQELDLKVASKEDLLNLLIKSVVKKS